MKKSYAKPWKKENRIYLKKQDKESCCLENSYCSMSLSNILSKIYERIILQQATNTLEENNFFKGKNLYAYKKKQKYLTQVLLPLIQQMCKGVTNSKYGNAVFADLQGTFEAVCMKDALNKLPKQVSLTILYQSFPAFSLTDSIET